MNVSRTLLRSYVGSSLFFGVLIGLAVCYLTFERRPWELCFPAPGLDAGTFADVMRICDIRVDALAHLFFTSFAVVSGSLLGPVVLALGGIAALRYLWRRRGNIERAIPRDRNAPQIFPAHLKQSPRSSFEKGHWMAKRWYFIVSGFVLAAGLTWSVAATYAALQHNPQGEFCDYSGFDGRGPSAWLGLDCSLQWRNLALFPLVAGAIGSVPLILYLVILSAAKAWRWLVQKPASERN